MSTFSELYAAQRESAFTHVVRRKDRKRKPAAVLLAGLLGTLAGRSRGVVQRYRRAVMYTGGLGFIDYGVWTWNDVWGYVAIGVSMLALDALSGGDTQ